MMASEDLPVWLRRDAKGVVLALHVQPGARRSKIVGSHGERLKVALQAAPVDGRANEALVRLLAELIGIPLRSVHLLSGATRRDKSVLIESASPAEVLDRLAAR